MTARRTDTVTRVIRADRHAIYAAFVDPAMQVRWLPPEGMTARFDRFEPNPGGQYDMTLTFDEPPEAGGKSDAASDRVTGRFVELVPGERIVQTADFASDDPAFAGTMTMTWTLEPVADGTRVTITASDVPPGITEADHKQGIASTLANLAAFVE